MKAPGMLAFTTNFEYDKMIKFIVLPSNSRLGVLEAPPSSSRSGGAIEGLAKGGVWTLLLGGRRAVSREGLRLLELPVVT